MSGSSLQFVFQNTTTIENLSRRTKVWQLAVHMPNPPQSSDPPPFRVVTYGQPSPDTHDPTSSDRPSNLRTFAILHSRPGENPFDLGYFRNFKSVMGDRWYDWLLPIKHSPCTGHDRFDCEFETGPVVERMKPSKKWKRNRDDGDGESVDEVLMSDLKLLKQEMRKRMGRKRSDIIDDIDGIANLDWIQELADAHVETHVFPIVGTDRFFDPEVHGFG
ncbi:MAG: hypothetical protein Q9219_006515 [cf. Caloplaca sp. 3 TL-2023]